MSTDTIFKKQTYINDADSLFEGIDTIVLVEFDGTYYLCKVNSDTMILHKSVIRKLKSYKFKE